MNETRLMQGFPPAEAGQVTLANWRKPPFNIWSFQHVREIVPSADIPNDPAHVRDLPDAPVDLAGLEVALDGRRYGFDAFLTETNTDGLVVLKKGRIAFEYYGNGMSAESRHILMSVSKSVLGLLVGILVEKGALDLHRKVTDLIPEIEATAYAGARLRDLLDMRAGILFDENYMASAGPIIEYRKAQGWDPHDPGENPSDLRSFFGRLTDVDEGHGGRFHYVSPNTDLLGWVIERATGRRYADLASELLWRPIGAARDAYVTVDRLGAPRTAGGFCATTRDLARLGQMLAEGGAYAGRQVVPAAWIEDILSGGDTKAWDRGDFIEYFPGLKIHYRNKWYVLHGNSPLLFGVGVFGQNLFVDRDSQVVISKFSSHALPMDTDRIRLTMAGVAAIRDRMRAA